MRKIIMIILHICIIVILIKYLIIVKSSIYQDNCMVIYQNYSTNIHMNIYYI